MTLEELNLEIDRVAESFYQGNAIRQLCHEACKLQREADLDFVENWGSLPKDTPLLVPSTEDPA